MMNNDEVEVIFKSNNTEFRSNVGGIRIMWHGQHVLLTLNVIREMIDRFPPGTTFTSHKSIEPSPESPIISQLERVATMLNLHPLTDDEMKGEIIIKGQDGHWYRILDIIESFLKRMK